MSTKTAVSRIKSGALPSDLIPPSPQEVEESNIEQWSSNPYTCASVLSISADRSFLDDIKSGYESDEFTKQLVSGGSPVPGFEKRNGLWYYKDRLVIPAYKSLREDLFRLAHDSCGHFGSDKCYALLVDSYYWPRMRRDLYKSYVPGCDECQCNKGTTSRNGKGPLHPLPVPDAQCESIAMDFIGPLPLDENFDGILSITDRLNSNLKVITNSRPH